VGKPSQFSPGDWVRVLAPELIQATLDPHNKTRGLWFADQQWPYCGKVFRVMRVVRRMLDDCGRMRPVSRTVLLDQTGCGGVDGDSGCGRDCPMMFRDEWLERVDTPPSVGPQGNGVGFVKVRSEQELKTSLNCLGRHDGLLLMPEMLQFADQSFKVHRKIETVFEHGHSMPSSREVYLLDGLFCSGSILGEDGPCDRGCRLLWHRDWLEFNSLAENEFNNQGFPRVV